MASVERNTRLGQRLGHWGELGFVLPPTPNRPGVGRLPYLYGTGGGNTRIDDMEIEASVFPIEAQCPNQSSGMRLEIPSRILIADIDEAPRELLTVVIHKLAIANMVPRLFLLLIRM